MANQSSRQLVLERRKALSEGGKKAVAANSSTANRVRSAIDARTTRTDSSSVKSKNNSSKSLSSAQIATQTFSSTSSAQLRSIKRVSQPSRELVLARREALSRRGKSADTSKDRTRGEISKAAPTTSSKKVDSADHCCEECAEKDLSPSIAPRLKAERANTLNSKSGKRRSSTKRRAIQNTSRALVLARREALSKNGKTAVQLPTSAASVARQGDPDLSSRELALRVRELRSKSGAAGKKGSTTCRPCGPNKNGAKKAMAAEAHWKVGISETSSGQVVTGTQSNRSIKTTGNEASTCRSITGTQYLGTEAFETFCQSALPSSQPAKVSVTNTTHGNKITGNEVGRSERVTGDEPGTCKNLTGTEYVSANQSNSYCGTVNPSPRKVGQSLTQEGRKVSGVMVGRSPNVTGNEAGSNLGLTGNQYLGSDPLPEGRAAEKVASFNTLRGNGVTGTNVSRAQYVTGNEPGSCKRVTGDEYVGTEQYQSFCGGKPTPEASKVGLSRTNKSQFVSGTLTGRSGLVTGDEPGTCKAITGTPYAGVEQASEWCNENTLKEIKQRTPQKLGTPGPRMTGQQPGIGGVMTGAEKGACESLTGTPYLGADQFVKACGVNAQVANESSDGNSFGTEFTVESPARSAQKTREQSLGVTGTSYESGTRITGPFDMAPEKVTGTEQFRFDNRQYQRNIKDVNTEVAEETSSRPISRITGEGQSSGLNITGDDWARGERVTGTEGVSARRRNPSRPGQSSAMPSSELKRNEELPQPDFLITGSSGNTREGQLVTFSGGARG